MAILHYSIYMSWISHNHKIRNILIDISSGTDNPKVLPNNILALHLQVVARSDFFPHSTVVFVNTGCQSNKTNSGSPSVRFSMYILHSCIQQTLISKANHIAFKGIHLISACFSWKQNPRPWCCQHHATGMTLAVHVLKSDI